MGVTTDGLEIIAVNMTGSSLLTHVGIGTSGTAFTSGDTALAAESDRNAFSSTDTSVAEEITFISDFAPTEVSGLVFREFGTFTTGSKMANREVLNGSVVFDGEQELQIQQTFKFFI